MFKKILTAAAIGVAAFGAQASSNLVTNGGFEGATIGGANAGDYCYSSRPGTCATAGWDADLLINSASGAWGFPNAVNPNGIMLGGVVAGLQTAGTLTSDATIEAGTSYTLTWDDAGRSGYWPQTYTVSLGGQSYTFSTNGGQGWAEHTVTFQATTDDALTFTGTVTSVDATTFIDNVRLTAVPEPANVLLMLVGSLGLVAWRRRSQI